MSEYKDVGIEDIIAVVKKKKGRRDTKIIQKAYDYAKAKHGDQLRKSGEPYIIHPVQVAYTLANLDLDDNTILYNAKNCSGYNHICTSSWFHRCFNGVPRFWNMRRTFWPKRSFNTFQFSFPCSSVRQFPVSPFLCGL